MVFFAAAEIWKFKMMELMKRCDVKFIVLEIEHILWAIWT